MYFSMARVHGFLIKVNTNISNADFQGAIYILGFRRLEDVLGFRRLAKDNLSDSSPFGFGPYEVELYPRYPKI